VKVSDVKPMRNAIDAFPVVGQGTLVKCEVRVIEIGPDMHVHFEAITMEQAQNSPARICTAAVPVSMKKFVMSLNGKEYGLTGTNVIKVPRAELPLQIEISFVYTWVGKDYKFCGHTMDLMLGMNRHPKPEAGCCVIS